MEQPLVSICVPTYNRPRGLQKTLESITTQSYKNLEIIVSDNASIDSEVEAVMKEFLSKDSRIKYFKQDTNQGAIFNFRFVREKASGSYFMWAADDDYFESGDLIEKLMVHAHDYVLVFPDFNIQDGNNLNLSVFGKIYASCNSNNEYLKAWCRFGGGYPIYGLYNLDRFQSSELAFEFDHDLAYYSEGTFLHKLFLNGGAKFVPHTYIRISEGGSLSNLKEPVLLLNALIYLKRSLMIYLNTSKIGINQKIIILLIVLRVYLNMILMLIIRSLLSLVLDDLTYNKVKLAIKNVKNRGFYKYLKD
jgi:glycosyltransferase involved in cell wall biosynthesis